MQHRQRVPVEQVVDVCARGPANARWMLVLCRICIRVGWEGSEASSLCAMCVVGAGGEQIAHGYTYLELDVDADAEGHALVACKERIHQAREVSGTLFLVYQIVS